MAATPNTPEMAHVVGLCTPGRVARSSP
jgi:hypothetical protein